MILLLKLLRSPLTYIVVLILACGALAGLWRHAAGQVAIVEAACEQRRVEAVNAALEEQAEAWESINAAQHEAVVRMAAEAGVASANARAWRERYEEAKREPKCQAWREAVVQCPTS